jgi:hypothetical protein
MDSIRKKNIRQDLQDYLDRRAFGLKASRRKGKNPINPVNPVQKKIKNRIHSTLSALVGKNNATDMLP